MRVNVYAEEMTDRIEIVTKSIPGEGVFTGVRFYLELPVTMKSASPDAAPEVMQLRGPFLHRPGDDDSSAVTFWGKRGLRTMLLRALTLLDERDQPIVMSKTASEQHGCVPPGSQPFNKP